MNDSGNMPDRAEMAQLYEGTSNALSEAANDVDNRRRTAQEAMNDRPKAKQFVVNAYYQILERIEQIKEGKLPLGEGDPEKLLKALHGLKIDMEEHFEFVKYEQKIFDRNQPNMAVELAKKSFRFLDHALADGADADGKHGRSTGVQFIGWFAKTLSVMATRFWEEATGKRVEENKIHAVFEETERNAKSAVKDFDKIEAALMFERAEPGTKRPSKTPDKPKEVSPVLKA